MRNSVFTRKDLVLSIANQDGGAHVDPQLDEDYAGLTRKNSIGWVAEIDGKIIPNESNPALASIRQIAYKVLESLKRKLPEYFNN
jgi:hypothetical protein